MHRKQLAEGCRQRGHHSHARRHAEQAAGKTKAQRLQKKNPQQVGGVRADRLQNGQHIHALFEMRVHGHGHADGSQNHRHQANQAQD